LLAVPIWVMVLPHRAPKLFKLLFFCYSFTLFYFVATMIRYRDIVVPTSGWMSYSITLCSLPLLFF
jgi:hypothetical protein